MKHVVSFLRLLAASLCALLLFAGCAREPYEKSALVMDTVAQLSAADGESKAAVEESLARLEQLDAVAGTGADGDCARLAAAAGNGDWVEISPEVTDMLALAQTWSERTDGAFDVTTGPLVSLWGIGTDAARVPAPDEIAAARAKVGWRKLELDAAHHRARLKEPGMSIDLGGIAKGYALDEIREIYAAHHVTKGLISLGGSSIDACGTNAHGEKWRVGVRDPRGTSAQDYLGVVPVSDAALSSSGDYERYFEQDGVRYCHILDPRTGAPAETMQGVTVIVRGEHAGAVSDLLTTALFVMGEERGCQLVENSGLEATALFVQDGVLSTATSGGMPDFRTLMTDVSGKFSWQE